jgi:hypothetical protein
VTSGGLSIDRIQLAVDDRPAAAAAWERLLGAAVVREDAIRSLACRRTVLAVGTSEVELLEADGAGPVEKAGLGLFAAGFATSDPKALREHLETRGVDATAEGDQLFIDSEALGGSGLRVVVSPFIERSRQGLLSRLYEVTNLVPDAGSWTIHFADLFDLDPTHFVPIRSEQYGYDGTLTLFREGELDRVEIIHPYDESKTMGRYHHRRGPCMYMCYGESDRADEIRERARTHAPDDWTGPNGDAPVDNLFLHPGALHGVMLGISRSSFAWTWSGCPERVEPA